MHSLNRCLLAVLGCTALLCLWLFSPVLLDGETLVSTDGCPYYGKWTSSDVLESYTGAWSPDRLLGARGSVYLFYPQTLLRLLPSRLAYHNGLYLLNLLLVAAGGYALLRALRAAQLASLVAGVGFAFSGYFLTLISAGHRGILSSIPWALFMTAALVRGVGKASPLYLCLAAVCAAFGLNAQADVMGLFILTAAVYGLFCIFTAARASRLAPSAVPARWWGRLAGAVLLAGVVFAATAMPFIQEFRRSILPGREQQITRTGEDPEVFCTNWSMPATEVAEFWAPNVFGRDSGNRELPYWGSLGRSLGWQPDGKQGGPGFRNLRQHTLYPGAVGLCLAFVALAGGVAARGRGRTGPPPTDEPRPSEVAFWGTVLGVSLLLAFGRYTPIYHYFFTFVPLADKLRCPVKLIHVTVMAIYILAGIGLDRWLRAMRNPPDKPSGWRRADVIGLAYCGVVLAALVGASMCVQGNRSALLNHWATLGFTEPGVGPRLLAGLSGALRHGIIVHAALAAVFAAFVFRRKPASGVKAGWLPGLVCACLLVLQGLDQGTAGRPYLRTGDVSGWYYNPIAERMKAEVPQGRAWWTYTPWSSSFFFGWNSFFSHGIVFASPRDQDALDDDYRAFYGALSKASTERLWQMTSSAFIIAPTEQGLPLVNRPPKRHEVMGYLKLDGQRQRWQEVTSPAESDFVVLRYLDALPRAQVYFGWQTVTNREQALAGLSTPDFRPDRDLLVTAGPDVPGGRASSRPPVAAQVSRIGGSYARVDVDAAEDGVLLLTDRYDAGWSVTVDGKPARPLQCDYMLRGVAVPKGRHTVIWTFRPFLLSALLSGSVFGGVLLWWLAAGWLSAKAKTRGTG